MKQRNSSSFYLMAWVSFGFFVSLMIIGLWTLEEPLMVKGYYLMAAVGLISSSFTVAKVVRDKQEDEADEYNRRIDEELDRFQR